MASVEDMKETSSEAAVDPPVIDMTPETEAVDMATNSSEPPGDKASEAYVRAPSEQTTESGAAEAKGSRFAGWKAKLKAPMSKMKMPSISTERLKQAADSVSGAATAAGGTIRSSGSALKAEVVETSKQYYDALAEDAQKLKATSTAAASKAAEMSVGAASATGSAMRKASDYTVEKTSSAYQMLVGRKSQADTASAAPAPGEEAEVKGVFGARLGAAAARDGRGSPIPHAVIAVIHTVAASGLQTEGIFRSGASEAEQERLMAAMDREPSGLLPEGTPVADAAAVLKRYLRDLPEPLLTFELYQVAVEAGSRDPALIRDSIASLPPPNFATLKLLISLLASVAAHSAVNRMSSGNLGMVFGPVLLWPRPVARAPEAGEGDSADMSDVTAAMERASRDAPFIASVVTHLIESYDAIFNIDTLIEQETTAAHLA